MPTFKASYPGQLQEMAR